MTTENRILQLLAQGRLVRGTRVITDGQGGQPLCLLTALTGNPDTHPMSCPADWAPAWLAYLVPWWDGAGTAERWPGLIRQIGELAPRFGELTGETGCRALAGCQLVSLRVALRHAGKAAPAVERVIALRERVLRGDEPTDDEWQAAAWAAAKRARATESSKRAQATKSAAWAAAAAARAGAVWAAETAARAIDATAWAAAAAAATEAADEIIRGHIDAIHEALNARS